ncbi:DUF1513 domain-containing protein [Thalassolituus sp. LLYu03]|uniref:DUF1513 domain-containing protein n=1 Tax=Thalassolituus sp. LLYu03 TaxID=3421656 RepID=UPI003D27CBEC
MPADIPFGVTRRRLLQNALALSVVAGLSSAARALSRADSPDLLLGGGRYQKRDGSTGFVISRVDPLRHLIERTEADFFPHGFAFAPGSSSRVYVFEKIGSGAGLFDLNEQRCLHAIAPVNGRRFYGHGACSSDNRYLFSTETSADGQGAIGVRDPQTLDYLGDFPSYGMNPHECRLLDNDRVLMVTNGGGNQASGEPGSVCLIDVHTQALLHKALMPDEHFNTGHFLPLTEDSAVVVSAPRLGLDKHQCGAVSQFQSGKLMPVSPQSVIAADIPGEALSIARVAAHNLIIVTHPTPGLLSFWSASDFAFRGQLSLHNARGVAVSADESRVWVSCGDRADIRALNPATLTLDETVHVPASYITGSHLLNLALI